MPKQSAGIFLYRFKDKELEVMLVHPGGPFWAKKDLGSWSIPKGEFSDDEDPLKAAIREFKEETSQDVNGEFIRLNPVKMKSGKWIYAFALEKDFDTSKIKSNTFPLEWPPKSGKLIDIEEVDRGEWFNFSIAKLKINGNQVSILEDLLDKLKR